MPSFSSDRNLLFGILALQMDFIRRDSLIAAMHAWVLDKAKPLGQILVEQGALIVADREMLDGLVHRHLEKHGDAERSLAAVAAPEGVRAELQRIADNDLYASLAQLPLTPSATSDAMSTTAPITADGVRFQILRPHASGGLGEVFVARDGELNREVALKEIQSRHADHPESRTRFVREAEITGGLEHPGIVPVYALGQYADGRPYYAMRFIRGDSLKQAIERHHAGSKPIAERNLDLRQLLGRFIAVCNAIAYAHSRGVLHRDLKPANIMLGEFGETLVVDWGLAKVVGQGQEGEDPERTTAPVLSATDSAELTRPGQALGTPAYMSTEQAAGRLDQVGPASDIYSLGATLYHLLTGKAPFAKSDLGEMLNQVQRGDFPPPRRINRQVPVALEAICLKAMALQPNARYASAKALADDVEHWLADEAVAAHVEPLSARLGRWVRHHKGLVGALTAVAVLAITVAVSAWLLKTASDRATTEQQLRTEADIQRAAAEKSEKEATTQRNRADRFLYFSRISLAHQAWQEAHIPRLDALLKQTQLEHLGGDDLHGFERNYLLRLRQTSLFTLKGHKDFFISVAFSPDGKHLATADVYSRVKLWDARNGQQTLTLKGHTSYVYSVEFSPDGTRLVSASQDGTVKVWDARTGQVIFTKLGGSAAFSPDGTHLASANSIVMKLWDARTGQETLTFKGHTGTIGSVAFSPDGHRLAAACQDGTVKLWGVGTGQETLTLRGHTLAVTSVAFRPDGQRLASASEDQTVKLWDVGTGQETLTLKGHTDRVGSVAFSPDGQRLASASSDRTVKLWDTRTGQETLTLKGHTDFVWRVVFSPDGQFLASAGQDGTVKLWDVRTAQESLTLKGHSSRVWRVAFSPDGHRLASASEDQTVKLWDARTGQETLTLKGHTGRVGACVAFHPDGQRLASSGLDGTVKLWDARTSQETLTLKGHTQNVWSVVFSPDGQRLASASEDQTVRLWDARTGQETLTLKGHTGRIGSVAFSPDGRRLASASFDGSVKLWDARTGQETLTLKGESGSKESVAFSPDGKHLVTANSFVVKLWDARTGQEKLTLKGHTSPIMSVAFSPEGHRLASASSDQTVKLWDVRTGQETLTFKGHTSAVYSVEFSPDGQRLASASQDGTVRIWDATPVSERSNLESQALSYFRFVAETVALKGDMIQQIRQTPTLSEPVREQALAFTEDYREIPARLDEASWSIVRRSWARPGAYALALRQAEAACRAEPENGVFVRTRGAAEYRTGQYEAALKTLTPTNTPYINAFKASPRVLALLAMTQFKLDQKAEAIATLERLRALMQKSPPDQPAEDLLQEAESLIEPKK